MIGGKPVILETDAETIIELGDVCNEVMLTELLEDSDLGEYFEAICKIAIETRASDIFWKVGAPPALRIGSQIAKLHKESLSEAQLEKIIFQKVLDEKQQLKFETQHELDIALELPGVARFRVNVYRQRGSIAMTMRLVSMKIPTLLELGLPNTLASFLSYRQGLILVTGPTGSGKSTTLAAMIELLNTYRRCNIVCIEDPIEYQYSDNLSIISQREVGVDTVNFHAALRAVLRQSPDVIMIGEIRDTETLSVAMSAAETGHLVLSTTHTANASETIERFIGMHSASEEKQIRQRLSATLLGICSQKLVPVIDGKTRVCAIEILVNNPTISKAIEEGNLKDIPNIIEAGAYFGMVTMNKSLLKLYEEGKISEENAITFSCKDSEMRQLLRKLSHSR